MCLQQTEVVNMLTRICGRGSTANPGVEKHNFHIGRETSGSIDGDHFMMNRCCVACTDQCVIQIYVVDKCCQLPKTLQQTLHILLHACADSTICTIDILSTVVTGIGYQDKILSVL